jgi:tRNA U34 5-methylaminomethyl-2-thiouridine-forming methyltransferase MnmC
MILSCRCLPAREVPEDAVYTRMNCISISRCRTVLFQLNQLYQSDNQQQWRFSVAEMSQRVQRNFMPLWGPKKARRSLCPVSRKPLVASGIAASLFWTR